MHEYAIRARVRNQGYSPLYRGVNVQKLIAVISSFLRTFATEIKTENNGKYKTLLDSWRTLRLLLDMVLKIITYLGLQWRCEDYAARWWQMSSYGREWISLRHDVQRWCSDIQINGRGESLWWAHGHQIHRTTCHIKTRLIISAKIVVLLQRKNN